MLHVRELLELLDAASANSSHPQFFPITFRLDIANSDFFRYIQTVMRFRSAVDRTSPEGGWMDHIGQHAEDAEFVQHDPGFEFDQRSVEERLALQAGEKQVFDALEAIADMEGVTLEALS